MKKHLIIGFIGIAVFGFMALSPLTGRAAWSDLTAKELKSMLDSGQKLLLVNPLSDIEYNEGHIPGSVNVPLHTIMRSKLLPADKDTLIVTYCLSQK